MHVLHNIHAEKVRLLRAPISPAHETWNTEGDSIKDHPSPEGPSQGIASARLASCKRSSEAKTAPVMYASYLQAACAHHQNTPGHLQASFMEALSALLLAPFASRRHRQIGSPYACLSVMASRTTAGLTQPHGQRRRRRQWRCSAQSPAHGARSAGASPLPPRSCASSGTPPPGHVQRAFTCFQCTSNGEAQ